MADIKQRRKIADYITTAAGADAYVLMNVGFTDLDEKPAAQTGSKRYVGDKSTTKSIKGYDWSKSFTADQVRSEEAIEDICSIGEKELTGADAERSYVSVDLDKKAAGGVDTAFEARRRKVAIEVSDFTNNDGEMQVAGNLLGIGDWEEGTFDTAQNKFTKK